MAIAFKGKSRHLNIIEHCPVSGCGGFTGYLDLRHMPVMDSHRISQNISKPFDNPGFPFKKFARIWSVL
jgi:hypothetical protein